MYKYLSQDGNILSSPDNISFIMNTDGAPVFKSSKVSIWPVFLIINELPFHLRIAKENMIFAGLWFGEKKPLMTSFLKPIFNHLNELEDGIDVESPERGKYSLKAALIACTCDLPARSIVTNMIQYNGAYCCAKCMQKGETARTGTTTRGSVHVFSFNASDPKGPPRTEQSMLENAHEAIELRKNGNLDKHVVGIKGKSWFMTLSSFHLVDGVAIDYMHGLLLGVQKKLLQLWFTPELAKEPFNISKNVTVLDKRLLAISPPSAINRAPRHVSDSLKYWKASEFRSFLLFYGVPLLCGLLPQVYLQHFMLFSHAIFILLKDNITSEDLLMADNCLTEFVAKFQILYGLRYCTLNLHQLVHLVDQVRQLGALWTHACFTFEDKIRVILKFIHGSQSIDSQIITAVSFTQKIPELIENFANDSGDVRNLKDQLSSSYLPKIQEKIFKNVYRLGQFSHRHLTKEELVAITECLGFPPLSTQCSSFTRIIFKKKVLIYGMDYRRMLKRNNAVVKITTNNQSFIFAQIKRFLRMLVNDKVCYFSIGNELKPILGYSGDSHITKVHRDDNKLIAFYLTEIESNCVFVEVNDIGDLYVCEFPNTVD